MLKLGILTDEISQDFKHALNVMQELGLEYVELQSLWDKKVFALSQKELREVKNMIADFGMKVSCISPHLFFNLPLRAGAQEKSYWGSYAEHLENLKRCVEIAHELGTNLIRTFTFQYEPLLEPHFFGNIWSMLLAKFEEPLKIAEKENIILASETCCYGIVGNCTLARKFIDDLGSNHMKVLWDIADPLYYGEIPYPNGYELIKNDIIHTHVDDGVFNGLTLTFNFCAPGAGQVKTYPQILKALRKNGYSGVLSIECEYVPEDGTKENAARESIAAFKKIVSSV